MKTIIAALSFLLLVGFSFAGWCRRGNLSESDDNYYLLQQGAYECRDVVLDIMLEPQIEIMESDRYVQYNTHDGRFRSGPILFGQVYFDNDKELIICYVPRDNYYDTNTLERVERKNDLTILVN